MTLELGKGYSTTNLKYMRKFYLCQIGQPLVDQLSWSHYLILMSLKDKNEIEYYYLETKNNNLSKRELIAKIKSNEYERLDEKTREKLKCKIEDYNYEIGDFIKHPVVIKNRFDTEEISEKMLKDLILEDMAEFLKQLGNGFTYIDNEYKLKMVDRYNYIDLLLFNYIYNCFVVVELKITEFKAEYLGQIKKYMNYIDKNLKTVNQGETIGIVICKKEDKYVVEYCSDERVFRTTFKLNEDGIKYSDNTNIMC